MLGYAFMGKAHTNAFVQFPRFYESKAVPRLVAIYGRSEKGVRAAASKYGYENAYTDWHRLVADDRIEVVDNGLPNQMHMEPCVEAAERGKHVICEKPLGINPDQSKSMLRAVRKARVKHMVGFNYRFLPAIRLAREFVKEGRLGKVLQFRAAYLQDWLMDENFPLVWRLRKSAAGSRVLGDLGSHIIDLARFMVGEIESTIGLTDIFVKERPLLEEEMKQKKKTKGRVDVDDSFAALIRFRSGAGGSIQASRFSAGRKNFARLEIDGSEGSLAFDLERPNELRFYTTKDREEERGFRTILTTHPKHPYVKNWWPPGHVLGWEHAMVNEMYHFFDAVGSDKPIEPYGATFFDGYRVDQIIRAIIKSTLTKKWEKSPLE
jgi:predicted dehydrogenase